jgi:hypothetical protein
MRFKLDLSIRRKKGRGQGEYYPTAYCMFLKRSNLLCPPLLVSASLHGITVHLLTKKRHKAWKWEVWGIEVRLEDLVLTKEDYFWRERWKRKLEKVHSYTYSTNVQCLLSVIFWSSTLSIERSKKIPFPPSESVQGSKQKRKQKQKSHHR